MNLAEKKGSFVFFYLFSFFCFFSIIRVRDKRSRTNARFCVAVTSRRKNDRGCCHSSSPWFQSRFSGIPNNLVELPRVSSALQTSLFLVHETDPDRRKAGSRARLVDILESLTVDCYFNEFKVRRMIATRPRPKYIEKRKGKLKEKNRWNNERER